MRKTFHLVALEIWSASDAGLPYESWSLAAEGFTHCTDGVEALGPTFDRFYVSDPRPFVAISLDLDALDVPWRYDVEGSPYPHIYGPIARHAVMGESRVERDHDGHFRGLTPI